MSTAAKNAGLAAQNKKISNHSICKASIFRLLDAGVPEHFVMQLSGHKKFEFMQISFHHTPMAYVRYLSRGSMSKKGTTSIREQIFHTSLF